MENLEEILIHMFYALESNDLVTYVELRTKAIAIITARNREQEGDYFYQ